MDLGKDILLALREMNLKDRPFIGLSQIGNCVRQNWYYENAKDKGKGRDLDSELTFQWGRDFERSVIAALKHAGYNISHDGDNQLCLTLEGITGSPDGVLALDNGSQFIIECKSAGSYGYSLMSRQGVEKANPGYFLQIQAYIEAYGADGGIFIVGSKENKKRSEDLGPEDIASLYVEWVEPIRGFASNHIKDILPLVRGLGYPARPYMTPVKFPCGYCDFTKQCWEIDND